MSCWSSNQPAPCCGSVFGLAFLGSCQVCPDFFQLLLPLALCSPLFVVVALELVVPICNVDVHKRAFCRGMAHWTLFSRALCVFCTPLTNGVATWVKNNGVFDDTVFVAALAQDGTASCCC